MNQQVTSAVVADSLFAPDRAPARSAAVILHAARAHLGMDVGFITEFRRDGTRVFLEVESDDTGRAPVHAGMVLPLSEGYCQRIVDGRLPELIPDTAQVPETQALLATRAIPIGAHISVPIHLADGSVYGTFCCFSYEPKPSLNARDLGMMHALADMLGREIDAELHTSREQQLVINRIEAAISRGEPRMRYQPIYTLGDDWGICGVEALSRFTGSDARTPDAWFNEAARVGLGTRLELLAVRRAVEELLPLPGTFNVALNVSPATVLDGELADAIAKLPPGRVVLEITEHAPVHDYPALLRALGGLRAHGVRLAIDDAGAGYASLAHVLQLRPEFIKLDISLTRGINDDPARRALATALVAFAQHTGSTIVAEGIETAAELAALHKLGVHRGQGFFMSQAVPLADFTAMLREDSSMRRRH